MSVGTGALNVGRRPEHFRPKQGGIHGNPVSGNHPEYTNSKVLGGRRYPHTQGGAMGTSEYPQTNPSTTGWHGTHTDIPSNQRTGTLPLLRSPESRWELKAQEVNEVEAWKVSDLTAVSTEYYTDLARVGNRGGGLPHRAQHLLTPKHKPPLKRDYVTEKPTLQKVCEYSWKALLDHLPKAPQSLNAVIRVSVTSSHCRCTYAKAEAWKFPWKPATHNDCLSQSMRCTRDRGRPSSTSTPVPSNKPAHTCKELPRATRQLHG